MDPETVTLLTISYKGVTTGTALAQIYQRIKGQQMLQKSLVDIHTVLTTIEAVLDVQLYQPLKSVRKPGTDPGVSPRILAANQAVRAAQNYATGGYCDSSYPIRLIPREFSWGYPRDRP